MKTNQWERWSVQMVKAKGKNGYLYRNTENKNLWKWKDQIIEAKDSTEAKEKLRA